MGEARVLQGRCPPEDVVDLSLRIIAEVRDIAKPEYLEESLREYRVATTSPKSLKRSGKARPTSCGCGCGPAHQSRQLLSGCRPTSWGHGGAVDLESLASMTTLPRTRGSTTASPTQGTKGIQRETSGLKSSKSSEGAEWPWQRATSWCNP